MHPFLHLGQISSCPLPIPPNPSASLSATAFEFEFALLFTITFVGAAKNPIVIDEELWGNVAAKLLYLAKSNYNFFSNGFFFFDLRK